MFSGADVGIGGGDGDGLVLVSWWVVLFVCLALFSVLLSSLLAWCCCHCVAVVVGTHSNCRCWACSSCCRCRV